MTGADIATWVLILLLSPLAAIMLFMSVCALGSAVVLVLQGLRSEEPQHGRGAGALHENYDQGAGE